MNNLPGLLVTLSDLFAFESVDDTLLLFPLFMAPFLSGFSTGLWSAEFAGSIWEEPQPIFFLDLGSFLLYTGSYLCIVNCHIVLKKLNQLTLTTKQSENPSCDVVKLTVIVKSETVWKLSLYTSIKDHNTSQKKPKKAEICYVGTDRKVFLVMHGEETWKCYFVLIGDFGHICDKTYNLCGYILWLAFHIWPDSFFILN